MSRETSQYFSRTENGRVKSLGKLYIEATKSLSPTPDNSMIESRQSNNRQV